MSTEINLKQTDYHYLWKLLIDGTRSWGCKLEKTDCSRLHPMVDFPIGNFSLYLILSNSFISKINSYSKLQMHTSNEKLLKWKEQANL
jgi:hypothetical protein